MKVGQHQNLVNLLGISLNGDALCIIMEYCTGGTLFDALYKNPNLKLSMKQRLKMMLDIASGMDFLTSGSNPILHRDIKSLK